MRRLLRCLIGMGCLCLPSICLTASAGAATVPSTGALLRAPVDIQGVCQRQTPAYPDSSEWGPDQDGTPYHGVYIYSSFTSATGDTPWPAPNDTFAVPPTDGSDPDTRPCDFGYADGKVAYSTHLTNPGAWVMTVTTVTYDETFDSVTGWVPQADDMSTTTKTVFFQVAAHNACHNGWFGTVPGTVACLNDDEKADAARAEAGYKQAAAAAGETYAGLGCGPGVTPNGEHPVHSTNIGRETQGACLAASATRIYDGVMAEQSRQLANDPPVKNYKLIAKPTVLKRLRNVRAIPAADIGLRSILAEEAEIPGLVGAIATTNNRANGAFVAGDVGWVQRQSEAATDYASDILEALETIQGYGPDARSELHALGASAKLIGLFTASQSLLIRSLATLAT